MIRQFLDAPPLALAAIPGSGDLVTLSNASTLTAWRGADGAKAWEVGAPLGEACPAASSAALAATSTTVLFACGGLAVGLDAGSGATNWRVPVGGAPAEAALSGAAAPDGSAFALAWASPSSPSLLGTALLTAADGVLTASEAARAGGRLDSGTAPVLVPAGPSSFVAAALTADGARLCSGPAGAASAAACAAVPADAGACTGLTAPLPGVGGHAVALVCEGGSLGAGLSPTAAPAFTPLTPGATAAAPVPSSSPSSGAAVAAAAVDEETGNVQVTSASAASPSTVTSSHALGWAAPPSRCATCRTCGPARAWALPPVRPRTDDPDAAGALFLVSTDGSAALVRLAGLEAGARGGGRAIGVSHWARPAEAGAGAVAALHAPLPPPAAAAAGVAASASTTLPLSARLAAALRTEWLAAKAMAGVATPGEAGELRAARAAAGGRGAPTADHHGFRQAVLVLGPAGSLLALHAGDGHLLWRLPGLVPAAGAGAARLLTWRSGDGRAAPPAVLVLWPGGWAAVDAWGGAVLEAGPTPFPVGQVVELPGSVRDGTGEDGGGGGGANKRARRPLGASEQRVVLLVEKRPSPPPPPPTRRAGPCCRPRPPPVPTPRPSPRCAGGGRTRTPAR